MTERYNTPAEGTLDWHIPLNENFNKLDQDVEIRDIESNLGGYEPKSNAKFLATDTGAVYVGDGNTWNKLGTIYSSSTSSDTGGEMADGTLVAEAGNVQSTLDAAENDFSFGGGAFQKVSLVSGVTYQTTSPIEVPSGVYLDCNGAIVEPQGDFNGIEVADNAWVERPNVHTKPVSGYSSAAIEISPKWSGRTVNGMNPTRVTHALCYGKKGEGVGVRFRGGPNPCGLARVEGHVINYDKGLQFKSFGDDTSGRGDWSNGNQFYGFVGQCDIMIHLKSSGAEVSGNTVFAQSQSGPNTKWFVRQEDDPRSGDRIDGNYVIRGNQYYLYPWDTHSVSNEYEDSNDRRAPIWYIGKGQQPYNVFYDLAGKHSNEFIVNNSDLAGRNGMFHGHGGLHTGATDFVGPKTYDPSSERKTWHPDSVN